MNTVQRIAHFTDCKLHHRLLLRDVQNDALFVCSCVYWHFGVFSNLGLSTLTVREVARDCGEVSWEYRSDEANF